MRHRSSVWLVAVAHALHPPTGLRKLTRSVASPELLDHNDAVTFLQETGVPTFAADETWLKLEDAAPASKAVPVDGADAILIEDALTPEECERLIEQAERAGFSEFDAGKNTHAALQVCVHEALEAAACARISRHIPREVDTSRYAHLLNQRWRFYRYAADGKQEFRPHVDAGFPPSSVDEDALVMDAHAGRYESRYSALFYLNDDFEGGATRFYLANGTDIDVKPAQGACLLIKQALEGEEWEVADVAGHAGTEVFKGRPKYVIRTDCMYTTQSDPNAHALERTLRPSSPIYDRDFLEKCRPLYSVHMGVENAASLLYSLIRFVKPTRVVEVGAGYTSLWLLRALADNNDELRRLATLQNEGGADLLNWPWCEPVHIKKSSLICVDNCRHQTSTARQVETVAHDLDLADRLQFVEGDAFELFRDRFDDESIDCFWLDFGVGDRVADFVRGLWPAISPGGFVLCHSSVTNRGTRVWLDAVRQNEPESVTGVPPGEAHFISFLEPHKHFQNSITVLQKRPPGFAEPLYSERA